jgi:hypothetical protein
VEKHSKVKIGALSTPKGYIRFVVLDQI